MEATQKIYRHIYENEYSNKVVPLTEIPKKHRWVGPNIISLLDPKGVGIKDETKFFSTFEVVFDYLTYFDSSCRIKGKDSPF